MPSLLDVAYRFVAFTPAGDNVHLSQFLETLTWSEHKGQLAMQCSASLRNDSLGSKKVAQLLAPGTAVRVLSDGEVFRGKVFSCAPSWTSDARVDIVCYDDLFHLQQSSEDRYVKEDTPADTAIKRLLHAWDVPIGTIEEPTTKLARKAFRNQSIANEIWQILAEAKDKGDGTFYLRMDGGKASTVRRGSNKDVWELDGDVLSSLTDQRSAEQLVTVVRIVGRSKGHSKTLAKAKSSLEDDFGTIQRIVNRTDFHTPAAAKAAAEHMIHDLGREQHRPTLVCVDVPGLRRGDRVFSKARTLNDFYIVDDVTHDAMTKTMAVTLDTLQPDEVEFSFESYGLWSWKPPKAGTSVAPGGIVPVGKAIEKMGYTVGENPAFGGVTGVCHNDPHAIGSRHCVPGPKSWGDNPRPTRAIDCNWPNKAEEPQKLKELGAWIQKHVMGVEELYYPGHEGNPPADDPNHLHLALFQDGGLIVSGGSSSDGGGGKSWDAVKADLKRGFNKAKRGDMAAIVDSDDFKTWVGVESAGTFDPEIVSPANNQGLVNGGLVQFWAGHLWAQKYFSKGPRTPGGAGNRFTMPVEQQAIAMVTNFTLNPTRVREFAREIRAGSYGGWG